MKEYERQALQEIEHQAGKSYAYLDEPSVGPFLEMLPFSDEPPVWMVIPTSSLEPPPYVPKKERLTWNSKSPFAR